MARSGLLLRIPQCLRVGQGIRFVSLVADIGGGRQPLWRLWLGFRHFFGRFGKDCHDPQDTAAARDRQTVGMVERHIPLERKYR